MTMRARLCLLAALAFCLLSLGSAWYAYRLVGEARVALFALAQQRRTLEAQIRQNQEKLAEEARARQALQAKLAGAAAARDGASATGGKPAAAAAAPPLDELLAADPKLFDEYLQGFRGNLHETYAALYRKYGLTPEQQEKFEALATAHEADIRDLRGSAEAQGLAQDDPGIAAMREQMNQHFAGEVVAQLGINVKLMRAAQTEQRSVFAPMQDSVDTIASAAGASQAPLSGAQAAQLAQLMAGSTPEYQAGKPAVAKDINWDAVLAQAPGFLTPAQLEGLRLQATGATITRLAGEYVAQRQAASRP
jgi:hypothetical protein